MIAESNELVEKVAKSMYLSEYPKKGEGHWQRLPEHRKDGYREKVEIVLLATMNAGFAIHEAGSCIASALRTTL